MPRTDARRQDDAYRVPSPDARDRACIRCGRSFFSTWAGHRRCVSCKKAENAEPSAPRTIRAGRMK